jgi:IMP dehydrogenase/GMP reductase
VSSIQKDTETTSLCFDDILLVPKHSKVSSRSHVDVSSILGNPNNPDAWIKLDLPVMTAPMEFINSNDMIENIVRAGGIAFIQRYQNEERRFFQYGSLPEEIKKSKRVGFAISLEESFNKTFINDVLDMGVTILLLDIANAHADYAVDSIKQLRSMVPKNIHIMTGNISSYQAYNDLMNAGADSVRVGIGGGAACTTRIVTGFGVPVLGSVIDIYNKIDSETVNGIISDGGIKNTGDIVKALAAGASAVMMGSMFAAHDECEGKDERGFLFRGIASQSSQESSIYGCVPESRINHVEGDAGYVAEKGKVENTLRTILYNIKSGLSYCGSENLESFRKQCFFINVSLASLQESNSRI